MNRYAGLIMLALAVFAAGAYSVWQIPAERAAGRPAPQEQAASSTSPPPATMPTPVPVEASQKREANPDFDFYVLALSWSPTYCASEAGKRNRQQCGSDARFGLVVHGLWPQRERDYPQDCASTEPQRVPDALGRRYLDIMPGMGLIGHEWRKHGTCSGLTQEDYLALVRRAFDKVAVPASLSASANPGTLAPADIERQFTAVNPGLGADGVAVTCEDGRFEEVRICLSKDLGFRACRNVDRNSCQSAKIEIPAAR